MKKLLPLFILSLLFLPFGVFASEPLSTEPRIIMLDVYEHNTPEDCWVVFDGKVYDLSEYLPNHDKFMDIRDWCGMDMTADFKDKAGAGRDHREGSYDLLEEYYIADLVVPSIPPVLYYTEEEVAERNTFDNCWMIYGVAVYDFSPFLLENENAEELSKWCGGNVEDEFFALSGISLDGEPGDTSVLPHYYIGQIGEENVDFIDGNVVVDESKKSQVRQYNILIPFLITTVLYWGMYFLAKKNKLFGMKINCFNGFWNTVLLVTLLVPGMAFGIFMILRTQRAELWDIDFDFMYWHVQLSLVMGFAAIYHFIQRFGLYVNQLKKQKPAFPSQKA